MVKPGDTEPSARQFVPFRVDADDADLSQGLKVMATARETFNPDDAFSIAYTNLIETLAMRELEQKKVGQLVVRLASGTRYTVNVNDRFAAMLSFGFLAETSDFNLFCRLVEPGSTIIDVGSNFGLYAIEAARIAGPEARVVAFEPVPEQFALLKKNVVMNDSRAIVEASDCAVAETAGERTFHVTESASFSGLTDTGRSTVIDSPKVSCIALDEWPSLENRPVHLMKIDVEGAELGVLKGARGVMARSPDLIIQFEATPKNLTLKSRRRLIAWLSGLVENGYVVRSGGAAGESGGALHDAELIGRALGGNLFLMRKGAAAEQKFLSCVADEQTTSRERAARLPGRRDMVEYLVPIFVEEFSRYCDLKNDLHAIRESTWWRLGQRFVFPVLAVLKRRR